MHMHMHILGATGASASVMRRASMAPKAPKAVTRPDSIVGMDSSESTNIYLEKRSQARLLAVTTPYYDQCLPRHLCTCMFLHTHTRARVLIRTHMRCQSDVFGIDMEAWAEGSGVLVTQVNYMNMIHDT